MRYIHCICILLSYILYHIYFSLAIHLQSGILGEESRGNGAAKRFGRFAAPSQKNRASRGSNRVTPLTDTRKDSSSMATLSVINATPLSNTDNTNHHESGAVVYLRVSTKKQEQRNELNIPAQQRRCEEWCKNAGIPVRQIFCASGESAWKTERPTLDEALDAIKRSKGAITHFVVQDSTRFSRNVEGKAFANAILKRLNVTLVSVDEPMLDDSPVGKLTSTMLTALGEFYSHSLSSRLRYRFQVHREKGRWLHQAPLGYRNVIVNGCKTLALDDSAPLLREAFELIATGLDTSDHVREHVTVAGLRTKKGRKLTRQTFSFTLKNPVYCGLILHKGRTYKGDFPAIVSSAVWQRAQDALRGKKAPTPKRTAHEDFPLRGFVKCGSCGAKLTSGHARGRSRTYAKYWCWNPKCQHPVSVDACRLEADWLNFLDRMRPAFHTLINVIPVLAQTRMQGRIEHAEYAQSALAAELAEKKALNLKLITARLHDRIASDDFETMKAALAEEMAILEARQRSILSEAHTFSHLLTDTSSLDVDPRGLWASAPLNERQTVQSVLFPDGISYRLEYGCFEPVNNQLEVMVFERLLELVAASEQPEILDGRALLTILNRAAKVRSLLRGA
jgi:site-specific DNA recombinase